MKYLPSLFAILYTLSASAQTISKGDHLGKAYKKLATPYFFKAPALTTWAEGSDMLMVCDKLNPGDCNQLFLTLRDTTLIGVFNTTEPNYFLLDNDGTSIPDQRSNVFILPSWVVNRRTTISASDTTILFVLNELYNTTLQANDGQMDEETTRRYQRFQTDTTLANRHIALLFDNYQTIVNSTTSEGKNPPAEICLQLMNTLAAECRELFGRVPVIVYIYAGEALESAGMVNEARVHFKEALQIYPGSVPLQVYNYRFEQDKDKQKQLLAELKKEHGDHWMVKNL